MAFGQQLAQLLHTWCECSTKLENSWGELVYDIHASISTLKCLQEFIDEDKVTSDGAFKVFTSAALDEVEALRLKCDLIFKAVILLIQKAVEDKKKKERNTHAKKKEKQTPNVDDESNLLIGPVPDLTSDKTLMGFHVWILEMDSKLGSSEHIKHCKEQLCWVMKGLVLQLQIARLARIQQSRYELNPSFRASRILNFWPPQPPARPF